MQPCQYIENGEECSELPTILIHLKKEEINLCRKHYVLIRNDLYQKEKMSEET